MLSGYLPKKCQGQWRNCENVCKAPSRKPNSIKIFQQPYQLISECSSNFLNTFAKLRPRAYRNPENVNSKFKLLGEEVQIYTLHLIWTLLGGPN